MNNDFNKIIQFLNDKYLMNKSLIRVYSLTMYGAFRYKHFYDKKDFAKYRVPALTLYEQYQKWYLEKTGYEDEMLSFYTFKQVMERLRFQLHDWQFAKSRWGEAQIVCFTPLIPK